MGLTEKQLGGWSLLLGTAGVAVGYALSPGRGVVDNVPSNSLTDLTLAMAATRGWPTLCLSLLSSAPCSCCTAY